MPGAPAGDQFQSQGREVASGSAEAPAFAPVPRQDAEMPSVKQEAAEQAPASEKEASQLAPGAEGSEGRRIQVQALPKA